MHRGCPVHRVHRTEKRGAAAVPANGDTRRHRVATAYGKAREFPEDLSVDKEGNHGRKGGCRAQFGAPANLGEQHRRYYDKIFTDRNRRGKEFSARSVVLAALSRMQYEGNAEENSGGSARLSGHAGERRTANGSEAAGKGERRGTGKRKTSRVQRKRNRAGRGERSDRFVSLGVGDVGAPTPPPTSVVAAAFILWQNYSERKIIQSPPVYRSR